MRSTRPLRFMRPVQIPERANYHLRNENFDVTPKTQALALTAHA